MTNKKLKIAFFNKQLPSDNPNGVSVQVHRLANELSQRGHELTCFSFSPKPIDALYKHIQIKAKSKSHIHRKFEAALEFRKIDGSNFDILHFHGDDFLIKGSNKKIRTFYGSAINEALHAQTINRFLYQSLFYIFEWISLLKKGYTVGISKATKKALPLIQCTIHCGVPENIYRPEGIKSNNPSILFIGDLKSRKRGAFLIEKFKKEILPLIPNCTLSIVGPEKCNGNNIIYLGQIKECQLIKEYQKAWLYCMPSSYEGFGVPAIEAMACKTAIVTIKNAATRELIKHKTNGIISTSKFFSRDIVEIIKNKELRETITKEGLNTFKQKFTIKQTADSYETLYFSILNKNNDR